MNNEIYESAKKQKISRGAAVFITAIVTFVLCAAIAAALYFTLFKDNTTYIYKYETIEPKTKPNRYNNNEDGYMSTIEEVAEMNEMTLDEFKEEWGLPSDMPGDTMEAVAGAYIPTSKYIEITYGMSYEVFTSTVGITEEDGIDENSPWGLTQKVMTEKEAEKTEAEEEATEDEATEDEVQE